MYSFPDFEPVCCSMSGSNCSFLTCIQISQEPGQVVWYSHLFKNFPHFVVIHTVKGFGIVNKAEIRCFSGILLLFWWSSRCWQFDLCFLCLHKFYQGGPLIISSKELNRQNWAKREFSRSLLIRNSRSIRSTNPRGQRRRWDPTPVLLPGKSHEWRSLAVYSPTQRVGNAHTYTHTYIFFIHLFINDWWSI